MNTRIVALVGIALLAVVALAVVTTWRLAVAVGPDVNNDGIVRTKDITAVVQAYGQDVPKKLDVREQNVDANGFIRVHEQGAVDVNVVPAGRVYQMFDAQPIGGFPTASPFVNTDGCRALTVFFQSDATANGMSVKLVPSPDGITGWGNEGASFTRNVVAGVRSSRTFVGGGSGNVDGFDGGFLAPFTALEVALPNSQPQQTLNLSAWLYCTS